MISALTKSSSASTCALIALLMSAPGCVAKVTADATGGDELVSTVEQALDSMPSWVPLGDDIPETAFDVREVNSFNVYIGYDPFYSIRKAMMAKVPQPIYICRALINGEYHPGWVDDDGCHVGLDGDEVVSQDAMILTSGARESVTWQPASGDDYPESTFVGGCEWNWLGSSQDLLRVCMVGDRIGKIIDQWGDHWCKYGENGVEKASEKYLALVLNTGSKALGDECPLNGDEPDDSGSDNDDGPLTQQVCGGSCPEGMHPTRFDCDISCGDGCIYSHINNNTYCAKNFDMFAQCDMKCPDGYHATSYTFDPGCTIYESAAGSGITKNAAYCIINSGNSFTQCGTVCPQGYKPISKSWDSICDGLDGGDPSGNKAVCMADKGISSAVEPSAQAEEPPSIRPSVAPKIYDLPDPKPVPAYEQPTVTSSSTRTAVPSPKAQPPAPSPKMQPPAPSPKMQPPTTSPDTRTAAPPPKKQPAGVEVHAPADARLSKPASQIEPGKTAAPKAGSKAPLAPASSSKTGSTSGTRSAKPTGVKKSAGPSRIF